MDEIIVSWLETYGDPLVLMGGGVMIGAVFGAMAQHSQFCLRSAIIDLGEAALGGRLAIWVVAFTTALIGVTLAIAGGVVDPAATRQLAGPGTVSGAAMGGAVFGVGMILSRACPGRLLVLTGQGNLRAATTGLVFAVVATAAYRGVLVPGRETVGRAWMIDPEARDVFAMVSAGTPARLAVAGALLLIAALLIRRARPSAARVAAAVGVGLAIALAYAFTGLVSLSAFSPVAVDGISFSRSSAETLLRLTATPDRTLDFDTGLVPGVVLGALALAVATRTFRVEGFTNGLAMARAYAGAVLMGVGAIAAAGCSVGAGVTGSVIGSLTALTALTAMTLAGLATHALLDKPRAKRGEEPSPAVASTVS